MSTICASTLPPPRPSSHPVDVGLRTEATIARRLLELGYSVSTPIGSNQRYDLIVDVGELLRVQCKTGRLRDGVVRFAARSTRVNSRGAYTRSYRGEVEFFAVYCAETDGVYLVPIEDATDSDGRLRVAPPRNNQARRIRWARDYELPRPGSEAIADLHSANPPA